MSHLRTFWNADWFASLGWDSGLCISKELPDAAVAAAASLFYTWSSKGLNHQLLSVFYNPLFQMQAILDEKWLIL